MHVFFVSIISVFICYSYKLSFSMNCWLLVSLIFLNFAWASATDGNIYYDLTWNDCYWFLGKRSNKSHYIRYAPFDPLVMYCSGSQSLTLSFITKIYIGPRLLLVMLITFFGKPIIIFLNPVLKNCPVLLALQMHLRQVFDCANNHLWRDASQIKVAGKKSYKFGLPSGVL